MSRSKSEALAAYKPG
jgi:hypothetical protein